MREHTASNIKFHDIDELFGIPKESEDGKIVEIPLQDLYAYHNHPFLVLDDEKMKEMAESIQESGVLVPGIVRPREEGGYEIIAGHRRKRGCELAGLSAMPVIIRDLDDDESDIIMVNSNIQREDILPSEKARAYAIKYNALKHQGKKGLGSSFEEVGKTAQESGRTVQRYIALSKLTDELLDMVDMKRIGIVQGANLSFLSLEEQKIVEQVLKESKRAISVAQSEKIKESSKSGQLTVESVQAVLNENRVKRKKFTLQSDTINRYFPEEYTTEKIEGIILELLEEWKKKQ